MFLIELSDSVDGKGEREREFIWLTRWEIILMTLSVMWCEV